MTIAQDGLRPVAPPPKEITVIGAGYVGLTVAVCMARFGFSVTCIERDAKRLALLRRSVAPFREIGMDKALCDQVAAKRLRFADAPAAMAGSDVIFVAVGTPCATKAQIKGAIEAKTGPQSKSGTEHSPGHEMGDASQGSDLSQLDAAVHAIGTHIRGDCVVVNKSTVPPGTAQRMAALLSQFPDCRALIVSNPEFLREGRSLADFMEPDRIVIGTDDPKAEATMRRIYAPLIQNGVAFLSTSHRCAELIKQAANAYLATRLAFLNQICDLCEKTGADIRDVAKGIGLDRRIGTDFFRPGPGYGGGCLPKDTMSLSWEGHRHGVRLSVIDAVIDSNDKRAARLARQIIARIDKSGDKSGNKAQNNTQNNIGHKSRDKSGKVPPSTPRVAILGITFKANTDDLRESPALAIARILDKPFGPLHIHDPGGQRDDVLAQLPRAVWHDDLYAAAAMADAIIIATEWDSFTKIDPDRLCRVMKGRLVLDLRNICDEASLTAAGLTYHGIGIGSPRSEIATPIDRSEESTHRSRKST